jgi:hypothetical protein
MAAQKKATGNGVSAMGFAIPFHRSVSAEWERMRPWRGAFQGQAFSRMI